MHWLLDKAGREMGLSLPERIPASRTTVYIDSLFMDNAMSPALLRRLSTTHCEAYCQLQSTSGIAVRPHLHSTPPPA